MCLVLAWRIGLNWIVWQANVLRLSWNSTWVVKGTLGSRRSDCIQRTLEAELAKLLYSTSVLDSATKVCFLDHRDIILGPRKIHDSEVDFLSSRSAPQFASENPFMERGSWVESDYNSKPWWRIPLRYLSILLTITQWVSTGWDRNRLALLTAKSISGLVILAYWSAPTMDL